MTPCSGGEGSAVAPAEQLGEHCFRIASLFARSTRHAERDANGGGGQCWPVAMAVEQRFGWPMRSGAYTTLAGEVICEAHYWNEIPGVGLFDATADQFCEGHDVRVITSTCAESRRCRPEWYQDWNPASDPSCPTVLGCSRWGGELDGDQANRLRRERGDGWWVTDPVAFGRFRAANDRYTDPESPQDTGFQETVMRRI
jgi:hypothetical protein